MAGAPCLLVLEPPRRGRVRWRHSGRDADKAEGIKHAGGGYLDAGTREGAGTKAAAHAVVAHAIAMQRLHNILGVLVCNFVFCFLEFLRSLL
jgi:hypothetical protein